MSLKATASRLDTLPGYVEKDLWVCIVLDVLYNQLPAGHPNLLFKDGASFLRLQASLEAFRRSDSRRGALGTAVGTESRD